MEGVSEEVVCWRVVARVITMMTTLVNNSVYIPKFDRGNMHIYLNKLQIWRFVTRVEKKMQGPLVWLSLPMDIKEASNDIVDDLCKDDGLDEVFKLLRTFQQERVGACLKARRDGS